MKWNRRCWWFAEREIKIPYISSHSTFRPIIRFVNFYFRENIYHQHKLELVSIARSRRKNSLTHRPSTKGDKAPNEWSRPLPMPISSDLFTIRFHLITIFFTSHSRVDVWTFTIIYQRPTTTRRKAFFPSIFLFYSINASRWRATLDGHAINLSFLIQFHIHTFYCNPKRD